MKVWTYYAKPAENDVVMHYMRQGLVPPNEIYPLFALTNSKKLKKSFEDIWNTDKFIRKIYHMTKDEYREFAMTNRGQVIEMYSMLAGFDTWSKNAKVMEIDMPITMTIKQELIDHPPIGFSPDIWSGDHYLDPHSVKSKYRKVLDYLGYTAAYNYYVHGYEEEFYEHMGHAPSVSFNETAWFVKRWEEFLRL